MGRDLLLPDGPGRLLVRLLRRIERSAHREQDSLAVLRDLHAHHAPGFVTPRSRCAPRRTATRDADVEIVTYFEVVVAQVRACGPCCSCRTAGPSCTRGEIRREVRALTRADADAAVAGAAATGEHDVQQNERQTTTLKHIYDSIAPCAHRKSLSRQESSRRERLLCASTATNARLDENGSPGICIIHAHVEKGFDVISMPVIMGIEW